MSTEQQNQFAIRRLGKEFGDLQCLLHEYDRLVLSIRTAYTKLGGAGAKRSWARYHTLEMPAGNEKVHTVVRNVDIGDICTEFGKIVEEIDAKYKENTGETVKLPGNAARYLLSEERRKAEAASRIAEEGKRGGDGK